jgi:hypothetical protein
MRVRFVSMTLAALLIAGFGVAALRADHDDQGSPEQSRIQIGYRYAYSQGIKLDLAGKNRASVGLGSYLVNGVGGCNDCHTAPPYTKDPEAFLGAPKQINIACYLAGGTEFGPFVSRDITPWENGKPAGLTFAQFKHLIRTGVDQTMSDHDLRAVYDYLSAIPAIPANTCGTPSE